MVDFTIKRCIDCLRDFPATPKYFHRNRANKDGLKARCKYCESIFTGHIPHPKEDLPEGQRRCTICKEIKPATRDFFSPNRHMRNGLEGICKGCKSQRASRDQAKNREKRNTYVRKRYAETLERSRCITRRKNHRRRAREAQLPATMTDLEWENCLRYWDSRCAYCGHPPGLLRELELTRDHWIPLTDPRPNNPGYAAGNILPACRYCNNSKNNRDPIEWLTWKFGKRKTSQIVQRVGAYFESLKE